jgi:hypothetical protein
MSSEPSSIPTPYFGAVSHGQPQSAFPELTNAPYQDPSVRNGSKCILRRVSKIHKCRQCPESEEFPTSVDLEVHARRTLHRPFFCQEQGCQRDFRRQDTLIRHMTTWHRSREPHSCDECEKTFKRKESLMTHKKFRHTKRVDGQPLCTLRSSVTSAADLSSDCAFQNVLSYGGAFIPDDNRKMEPSFAVPSYHEMEPFPDRDLEQILYSPGLFGEEPAIPAQTHLRGWAPRLDVPRT